jgi:hypothetical protein
MSTVANHIYVNFGGHTVSTVLMSRLTINMGIAMRNVHTNSLINSKLHNSAIIKKAHFAAGFIWLS